MRRLLKWTGLGLSALVGALVLGLAGLYLASRHDGPARQGTLVLPGLSAPVSVARDGRGVPVIEAANRTDAMAALGYVHAQDRLWQMEIMRRIGAGRLAEVAGPPALTFDRFTRALGLYAQAEAQFDRLPAAFRAEIEAYARGVNAFIDDPDQPLPPEYTLLFMEAEPWRPADSLVWGKLMTLQLSGNWWRETGEAALRAVVGPERVHELFPPGAPDAPATVASAGRADGVDFALLRAFLPKALVQDSASNSWAVAPERSATGAAILASDPHLGFTSPNLWYLARIETPDEVLAGATVAGVPLMVIGHNGRVAWGFTTTHADTQDLVVETVDPADPTRYLTPDGPLPFEAETHGFRARFGNEETLTVRRTRHGVVLSDIWGERFAGLIAGGDKAVALLDAGLGLAEDDASPTALWRLNRARDVPQALRALSGYGAPLQNIHLADTQGNIAVYTPGRLPVRADGLDGLAPIDGATTRQAWTGLVPVSAYPLALNPGDGILFNANSRLTDEDYPYLIAARFPEAYRQARLAELTGGTPRIGIDDSLAWQMDTVSLAARRLTPLLTRIDPPDPIAGAAVARLRDWNHRMQRDRPEPLIYMAWTRELVRAIAEDELGPAFDGYWGDRIPFLIETLSREGDWCDRIDTDPRETCDFMLETALVDSLNALIDDHGDDIADWRWGDVHVARFSHRPLGFLPLIGGVYGRSIETDGGDHTLNRGQTPGGDADAPFAHRHGPGLRAVFDLGDLDDSRFVIAMGQSGNPHGPWFDDWLVDWRDGVYRRLPVSAEAALADGGAAMTLEP